MRRRPKAVGARICHLKIPAVLDFDSVPSSVPASCSAWEGFLLMPQASAMHCRRAASRLNPQPPVRQADADRRHYRRTPLACDEVFGPVLAAMPFPG